MRSLTAAGNTLTSRWCNAPSAHLPPTDGISTIGQEVVFSRIRIIISNAVDGTDIKVQHPLGQDFFPNVPGGQRGTFNAGGSKRA